MNEPQKKYLTTRERICFTVGAFGRSGIYLSLIHISEPTRP